MTEISYLIGQKQKSFAVDSRVQQRPMAGVPP